MIYEDDDDPNQLALFPDLPKLPLPPPFEPTTTCAHCSHIVAVRFAHGNLFFCKQQDIGAWKYGRKIKKNMANCEEFSQGEGLIPHLDGHYGGTRSAGLTRGIDTKERGLLL